MSAVGTIVDLWRFPVKSMLGERLDTVHVEADGVVGDRAFVVVDVATGEVASAGRPRRWADLLRCRAAFLAPPAPGRPLPPARLELGDGTVVRSDDADVDDALSRFVGRPVRLAAAEPNPFPVSLLTTASLRHMRDLVPAGDWDVRRFRMNVTVETPEPGLVENGWVRSGLALGSDAAVAVGQPTARCVMIGLPVEELPPDRTLLKAVATHNRVGREPCLGVYARVARSGQVRVGDAVTSARS
ncbi:MOSC domain-containing protein [Pseudonocardia sp. CA-107938]|uniref:MOSC domain-containing protein n=1 Tax=Pseudonocardia sp. CA-107938 TaxID=3240021 RepID=UPI003D89D8F4